MDDFTEGMYGMILGIDLVNTLGLELKFFDRVIVGGKGPHEGYLAHMVEASN